MLVDITIHGKNWNALNIDYELDYHSNFVNNVTANAASSLAWCEYREAA